MGKSTINGYFRQLCLFTRGYTFCWCWPHHPLPFGWQRLATRLWLHLQLTLQPYKTHCRSLCFEPDCSWKRVSLSPNGNILMVKIQVVHEIYPIHVHSSMMLSSKMRVGMAMLNFPVLLQPAKSEYVSVPYFLCFQDLSSTISLISQRPLWFWRPATCPILPCPALHLRRLHVRKWRSAGVGSPAENTTRRRGASDDLNLWLLWLLWLSMFLKTWGFRFSFEIVILGEIIIRTWSGKHILHHLLMWCCHLKLWSQWGSHNLANAAAVRASMVGNIDWKRTICDDVWFEVHVQMKNGCN